MTYIMSEPQKRQNPNEHQHLAWKVLNPINTFYKAYLKKKKSKTFSWVLCSPIWTQTPSFQVFLWSSDTILIFIISLATIVMDSVSIQGLCRI